MPVTYKKIASVTVGAGGAATMDFNSIPGTYTDLKLIISAKTNAASISDFTKIRFNGVSTSYSNRNVYGQSGSPFSSTNTEILASCNGNNSTASTFGNSEYYLPNYTGNTNKSVSVDSVSETNGTNDTYAWLAAGLWSNTAAITSISLSPFNGTSFNQYSTATLYGISKS